MVSPETSAPNHRLISKSAWAFGGKAVSAVTILASNALMARLLTPQDLGTYYIASSLVMVAALIGSLGLNLAVVRFIAESIGLNQPARARQAVGKVLALCLLGTLVVGVLFLLLGPAVGAYLFSSPALVAVTGLLAAWMAVTALQTLLSDMFRGFHDIRLATVFGGPVGPLTWTLITICLGMLWLLDVHTSLATIILLAILSGSASTLLAGLLLRREVANLPSREEDGQLRYADVLRVAWPLLVSTVVLFVLAHADLWIVGAFGSGASVGVYGAVSRLVLLVATPLVIVNLVVPPLISQLYVQGKTQELERTLRTIATLVSIPAFLLLMAFIVFGGPLLGLAFGDYYTRGVAILIVLSVGQLVKAWTGACEATLVMTGHEVAMMRITIAGGLVMVVLGLVLVELYGAFGVAIAAAAGWIFQSILVWLEAKLTIGIWTHVSLGSLRSSMKMVRDLRASGGWKDV